jgi:hypothetical protein
LPAEVAFFAADGEALAPSEQARGPWSANQLHGRLAMGLLARAVESADPGRDLVCARLTVDLFRAAPLVPVTVRTEVVRESSRLQVLALTLLAGELEVARASAVRLRPGEQPPGTAYPVPAWDAPDPESVPAGPLPRRGGGTLQPGYDLRAITEFPPDVATPTRIWVKERQQLVDGEPLTPFVRAALVADLASPMTAWGDHGVRFINADVTLSLHRAPVGEWIGLESRGHLSAAGIGTGSCVLHDAAGPVGFSTVCSLAAAARR